MERISELNQILDLLYKQHGRASFDYSLSLNNGDITRAELYYNRMQMIADNIIKVQDELKQAWHDYKGDDTNE